MVWKLSEEEAAKQPKNVRDLLKDREAGVRKPPRPAQDIDTYRDNSGGTPQPKSRWDRIREGILKGGEKAGEVGKKGFGKAQEFARNHPMNNPPDAHKSPKKEPNRANWKEAKEPRGRVSQRDIYKDGVLVEKVHYGPAKQPKQPRRRGRRSSDPLGGIGAGMTFNDLMPGSNLGTGLGGMMPYPGFADPTGRSAPPRPRKGKKGSRRQPRERMDPMADDFLDRMYGDYPKPWEGKF
jgi:hypothetical protein